MEAFIVLIQNTPGGKIVQHKNYIYSLFSSLFLKLNKNNIVKNYQDLYFESLDLKGLDALWSVSILTENYNLLIQVYSNQPHGVYESFAQKCLEVSLNHKDKFIALIRSLIEYKNNKQKL